MSPTGTNFYVEDEPTCDNPAHILTLHIGKSSAGWKFGFHAIPDRGLTSWAAWKTFLAQAVQDGRQIKDEYGRTYTYDRFVAVVQNKQIDLDRPPAKPNICHVTYMEQHYPNVPDPRHYHDSENYDMHEGEFS